MKQSNYSQTKSRDLTKETSSQLSSSQRGPLKPQVTVQQPKILSIKSSQSMTRSMGLLSLKQSLMSLVKHHVQETNYDRKSQINFKPIQEIKMTARPTKHKRHQLDLVNQNSAGSHGKMITSRSLRSSLIKNTDANVSATDNSEIHLSKLALITDFNPVKSKKKGPKLRVQEKSMNNTRTSKNNHEQGGKHPEKTLESVKSSMNVTNKGQNYFSLATKKIKKSNIKMITQRPAPQTSEQQGPLKVVKKKKVVKLEKKDSVVTHLSTAQNKVISSIKRLKIVPKMTPRSTRNLKEMPTCQSAREKHRNEADLVSSNSSIFSASDELKTELPNGDQYHHFMTKSSISVIKKPITHQSQNLLYYNKTVTNSRTSRNLNQSHQPISSFGSQRKSHARIPRLSSATKLKPKICTEETRMLESESSPTMVPKEKRASTERLKRHSHEKVNPSTTEVEETYDDIDLEVASEENNWLSPSNTRKTAFHAVSNKYATKDNKNAQLSQTLYNRTQDYPNLEPIQTILNQKGSKCKCSQPGEETCGNYCKHLSARQQKVIINELIKEEKERLASLLDEDLTTFALTADLGHVGDRKYIIAATWWRKWSDYVNFTAEEDDEEEGSADGPEGFNIYEKPDKISNSHLLDPKNPSRNWLKTAIVEHFDYEVVCRTVWQHIYSWYSCDETICRQIVGGKKLELYPEISREKMLHGGYYSEDALHEASSDQEEQKQGHKELASIFQLRRKSFVKRQQIQERLLNLNKQALNVA